MLRKSLALLAIVSVTACSGIRTTDETFTTHAESFNILFLQVPPSDSKKRALEMVPEGGKIVSMQTTPDDLTSFLSVVNRIIGIDISRVEGTLPKK